MAKVDKVKEVVEVLKEGGEGQKSWKLVKALTESGEQVTGFNLKDNQSVVLIYNDKYQNYNAVPISGWQEVMFKDLEEIKKMIIGDEKL